MISGHQVQFEDAKAAGGLRELQELRRAAHRRVGLGDRGGHGIAHDRRSPEPKTAVCRCAGAIC